MVTFEELTKEQIASALAGLVSTLKTSRAMGQIVSRFSEEEAINQVVVAGALASMSAEEMEAVFEAGIARSMEAFAAEYTQ